MLPVREGLCRCSPAQAHRQLGWIEGVVAIMAIEARVRFIDATLCESLEKTSFFFETIEVLKDSFEGYLIGCLSIRPLAEKIRPYPSFLRRLGWRSFL